MTDSLKAFREFSAEDPDFKDVKIKCLDERARVRESLYVQPLLRQLFFEITLNCNEHCFHCGSHCAPGARTGLSLEKYREILDDVKTNIGTKGVQVCLTGGEPLLRPDFFELTEYIHSQGFVWGMTTNATLITKEVAHKLSQTGMGTISVSIDGLEETHDKQRGLRGGYRRAMNGLQNLIEEGTFKEVQVTTVINHKNINELEALYDIFQNIDIDSWRVFGVEPIGRALDHPDMLLTPEDQSTLFRFIISKRREGLPVCYGCSHFLGEDIEGNVRDTLFLCNAGLFTASILADGSIVACLDIDRRPELIFGNVMKDQFSQIWKNEFKPYRRHLSQRCAACQNCEYEKWCAGGAHHSFDYDKNEQKICLKGVLF